jgi:hypothetical protein
MCTATRQTVTCPKCHGAKRLQRYSAIAEGLCFTCAGAGTITVDMSKTLHTDDGPAYRPAPDVAIDQLRIFYKCARNLGMAWFNDEGESGVGMGTVRWYCESLPAEQGAKIVAAFEALRESF